MLTSKKLIENAGISRATLNNYVARGLLPKPLITKPGPEGAGARQIGYFPDNALERLEEIKRLKKQGATIEQIAARFRAEENRFPDEVRGQAPRETAPEAGRKHTSRGDGKKLRLTIDQIPHPAYMVNYNFELAWYNEPGRDLLLGGSDVPAQTLAGRNVIHVLINRDTKARALDRIELLKLNLALAKDRLTRNGLLNQCPNLTSQQIALLDDLFQDTRTVHPQPLADIGVRIQDEKSGELRDFHVYACYFREGILLVFTPFGPHAENLIDFLMRRDLVIRDLLSKRLPVLTPLAVLVADLQESVKICSELPADEYFELINQIWSTMGAILRKYYSTPGKHAGDGLIYYFFPQPDCKFTVNALICAQEIKGAMRKISKEWQLKKNWLNELHLNIALNEGQEWVGTFQTQTTVEFSVLGDTINHTARLSDFARNGAIWATKNFVSKLDAEERKQVRFGVRRSGEGKEIFVESTYSYVSGLVDLNNGKFEKLKDIAGLAVTEIIEVALPAPATRRGK